MTALLNIRHDYTIISTFSGQNSTKILKFIKMLEHAKISRRPITIEQIRQLYGVYNKHELDGFILTVWHKNENLMAFRISMDNYWLLYLDMTKLLDRKYKIEIDPRDLKKVIWNIIKND